MSSIATAKLQEIAEPGFVWEYPERIDLVCVGRHHAKLRIVMIDGTEHTTELYPDIMAAKAARDRLERDGYFYPL